jgi:hypothetical protein
MITENDINTSINYDSILSDNRINTAIEVPKPPTILSIKDVGTSYSKERRIFTLGNFSAIKGKMKAKKTFLISLLTSSVIKGSDYNNVFIGELPADKKLVVYIDTEQGTWDSWNCINRIEKMAGTKENFMAFNLRPFSPTERCEILEFIFNKYKERIGLMILDGIADLVSALNDELEATRVTSMLLKYTALYNSHISVVIHENKANDFATGHIGSAVLKKAEIIISVTKCKNIPDSSDVVCDYSRGHGFEPFVMTINEYGYPYVNTNKVVAVKEKAFYEENIEPPF